MTAPPPKILFVMNSLNVGGMEKRVTQIALALQRAGWPVGILCLSETGLLEPLVREAGLRLDVLQYKGISRSGPLGVGRTIRAGRAVVRDFQPDIVQAFLPVGNMFANLIAGAGRRTRFVAGKVTSGFYYRRGRIYGRVENWTLRRATLVYCNGENIRHELVAECDVPASRVRVIHNGIAVPPLPSTAERNVARAALRNRLGLPPDAIVLGMVANLFTYKGHRFAIEAAAEIVSRYPTAHFVFPGRNAGEREPLARQADILGIANHIHMPGPIEDVRAFLLGLDVCFSSSLIEGFSNVWLEGMAAALPCVFTRVGAAAEAFQDGHDCLLVPAEDAPALRDALLRVLDDPALAERLARQGYATVAGQFSIERMVEAFMQMYREILATRE